MMDPRFPPTPVRLPPEGPGGTQTPRQSILHPPSPRNVLPNTSPSPYRKKRTYLESHVQAPAESSNPGPILQRGPVTKMLIQEEIGRLQVVIDAGRTLSGCFIFDELHLELEDSAHHPQVEDPYQQTTSEFIQTHNQKIPLALFDRYAEIRRTDSNVKIASGILSEIRRIWFGIDRKLLLWDYEAGEGIAEVADLPDAIVSVAVIPKNPDLFTNKVQYMLLISTPTDIRVFGVVTEPSFKLLPTDLSIPSNEENYHQFAYYPNGRVFMGGADGGVSELKYGNVSWFSNARRYKREDCSTLSLSSILPRFLRFLAKTQVAQLSADSSRHLLYSLVEKSNRSSPYRIDVYDLGFACDRTYKCLSINAHTLLQRLREHNPRLAGVPAERLAVVHISALPRGLSIDYHLLALTKNGIRIYITLHLAAIVTKGQEENSSPQDEVLKLRPTGDFSIWVKFPPVAIKIQEQTQISFKSQAISTTADKPSIYDQAALLEDGTLVLLDRRETDIKLLTIRRALPRVAQLQEQSNKNVLEPDENVCCVEEFQETDVQMISDVPIQARLVRNLAELCGVLPRSEYTEMPTVHWLGTPGVSISCLSSLSNYLYISPAQFRLLTSSSFLEYSELRPIDVLCDVLEKDGIREVERVREMSDRYGLVHVCTWLMALISSSCMILSKGTRDSYVLEPVSDKVRYKAKAVFRQLGSTKMMEIGIGTEGHMPDFADGLTGPVEHKAIALHLSRILRPIWFEKISYCEGPAAVQIEQLTPRHFGHVSTLLKSFLAFLEDEYRERLTPFTATARPRTTYGKDQIYQMYFLAMRALQGIALLSILSADYGFRRVANELPASEQNLLSTLTFKELISTRHGQDLSKSLIEAYVRQVIYTRQGKNKRTKLEDLLKEFTESIPSFFTPADAEIYIAEEAIIRAKTEQEVDIRRDFANSGMQKLLKNAASVCLHRAVEELLSIGEVMGVIVLCLKRAKDISEIKVESGTQEIGECYETIYTILNEIERCLEARNPDLVEYLSGLDLESVLNLRQDILRECCKVQDKQLHWAIFNWLVQCDLTKQILHLDSGFVLEFLESKFDSNKFPTLSYIADYSMKLKDYKRAYLEYGRLAAVRQDHTPVTELISLERRNEFLELSLLCLDNLINEQKSSSPDLPRLSKERESLIFNQQLCRIQIKIQRELVSAHLPDAENLSRGLLSAEELYEKIAKPKGLLEAQLELLHFIHEHSNSQNPQLLDAMKSLFLPIITNCGVSLWPQRVREKLEELGRKYPYSFPLDSLCKHCETVNCQLGVEASWVLQLLASLPLSQDFSDLFRIYSDIWLSARDSDLDVKWTLLLRLETLLKLWIEAAERRIGSGGSVWASSSTIKCSRERLIELIPGVFRLIEDVQTVVMQLSLDRQRRIEPSFLDLKERFGKLDSLLKAKSGLNALVRSPNSSFAGSLNPQNSSLLPPKALFRSPNTPPKGSSPFGRNPE